MQTSKALAWGHGNESVRSEWTNVTWGGFKCEEHSTLTDRALSSNALANVGASCIAILSSNACRKSTKGSSQGGQEIHSAAYLAKVGLLKRDLSLPTMALGPGPGLWRSTATLVEQAEGCTWAEILCLSAKTSALRLLPLAAWLPSQAKATVKILSGHRKHLCSDLAPKS